MSEDVGDLRRLQPVVEGDCDQPGLKACEEEGDDLEPSRNSVIAKASVDRSSFSYDMTASPQMSAGLWGDLRAE
jgi:hypothetical protein